MTDPTQHAQEPVVFSHGALQDAMRAFSSHLAHDLNNQLATIRLGTQMLERSVETDAGLDVLRMVNRSIERATRMVADLGVYASGVRGEPEPVALSPFLRELVAEATSELPDCVQLKAEVGEALPQIDLHREALEHSLSLLFQFLGNCLSDASEAGGSIDFAALEEPEHLLLRIDVPVSIVPVGSGVEALIPCFNKNGNCRGTGLALAVLERVVRDHGGALSLDCESEKQTRLQLRLPLMKASPPQTVEGTAASAETEQVTFKPSQTILIIDDEEPLLDLVGGILNGSGANVLLASSAVEGMKHFKRNQDVLDLLICDVKLPGLPGLELVNAIRSVRDDLPVLFLSGAEPSEVGTLPENCQFLGKPFHEKDLLQAIESLRRGTVLQ